MKRRTLTALTAAALIVVGGSASVPAAASLITKPAAIQTVGHQSVKPSAAQRIIHTAYTTGYGWWDNTPRGSSEISNPVLHEAAGGTGTWANPVTVAVGHSIINGKDILDIPEGTRLYVPNLRKYLIVEDTCGDGPRPQTVGCHDRRDAPKGATVWVDIWVGGSAKVTHRASDACESAMTDANGALHELIVNPAANLRVVAGDVLQPAGCKANYGNAPLAVR